jgi:hypothetical protein
MQRNGPEFSWSAIVGLFIVLSILGAVVQIQLNGITKAMDNDRADTLRRDVEIKNDIKTINERLLERDRVFVTNDVFKQREHAINDVLNLLQQRMTLVEQSRPTTGELKATTEGFSKHLNAVDERLNALTNRVNEMQQNGAKQ